MRRLLPGWFGWPQLDAPLLLAFGLALYLFSWDSHNTARRGHPVLGLLALIAVGGLIPFWMWVYFVYNPPIR